MFLWVCESFLKPTVAPVPDQCVCVCVCARSVCSSLLLSVLTLCVCVCVSEMLSPSPPRPLHTDRLVPRPPDLPNGLPNAQTRALQRANARRPRGSVGRERETSGTVMAFT